MNSMKENKIKKISLFRRIFFTKYFLLLTLVAVPITIAAVIPNTFNSGETISSSLMNANFGYLINRVWDRSGLADKDLSVGYGHQTVNVTTETACTDFGANYDGWIDVDQSGGLTDGDICFTSSLVIDTTNGNMGIGTTSPGEKLTVAGTIESTTGGIKFPDGSTQTAAGYIKPYVGTTACTYDGGNNRSGSCSPPESNIATGPGYGAANAICAGVFGAGARVCTSIDLILTDTVNKPGFAGRVNTGVPYGNSDTLKHVDCTGWRLKYGNTSFTYIQPEPNGFYFLASLSCNTFIRLACCK